MNANLSADPNPNPRCVVCTDKDDGWFIMLLKRQTFYATTTVACFMLYSALDLAGDSFSNHLQEEVRVRVGVSVSVTVRVRGPFCTPRSTWRVIHSVITCKRGLALALPLGLGFGVLFVLPVGLGG